MVTVPTDRKELSVQSRKLRNLLDNASGTSECVIAVNLDIRGFSKFSTSVESFETAVFVKNVYKKLIDGYFPSAPFVKLTGDGLLIVVPIIPYDQENLNERVVETIGACLEAVKHFPSFLDDDATIYFKDKIPRRIGIGISMGSACRLASGDNTLDYSGRPLNLASRLMDVARPSGIVCDASMNLPDDAKSFFAKDRVFVPGIAESSPLEVHFTKNDVKISPHYKRRLDILEWHEEHSRLFRVMDFKSHKNYAISLASEPIDKSQIAVWMVVSEKVAKRWGVGRWELKKKCYSYRSIGGEPKVSIHSDGILAYLRQVENRLSDRLWFEVRYPT